MGNVQNIHPHVQRIHSRRIQAGLPFWELDSWSNKSVDGDLIMTLGDNISNEQWAKYETDGYLRLGQVATNRQLAALQQRMNEIMLGTAQVNYERMLMQLDSETGKYDEAGPQTKGFKGPTLNYRKIQDLEFDPVFLEYMQHPVFQEICARAYGETSAIDCFRAMFMNKPAHRGTVLPWHQDRWPSLDIDPQITVWTALDPATLANGCVQIIVGSHRTLVNPEHGSGFVTKEQADAIVAKNTPLPIELDAGEVVLLHNWTLHHSDTNKTSVPRKAFSVCYMDARTKSKGSDKFTRIFGPGSLTPADLAPIGVR